jgi:hypothetical protein
VKRSDQSSATATATIPPASRTTSVRDISKWFEARSRDRDSAGIRRYLGNLVDRLKGSRAGRPNVVRPSRWVATLPDPERPDEPVNSL